jgi:hypothetical protein
MPESCNNWGDWIAPAGDQHLARRERAPRRPVLAVLHTRRARAFGQYTRGERVGRHDEVGSLHRGAQIRDRGAAPQPAPRRALVVAQSLLTRTVEVVVARDAYRLPRREECVPERVPVPDVRYRQRPPRTVPFVLAARLIFRLAKVRQALRVAPPGIAEVAPVVEVLALPADVDQTVDRAGAAEDTPSRNLDVPVVHPRLRLGLEHPVDLAVEHDLAETDRHVDPGIAVAPAGLEEQHAMRAGLGQAVGQHAPGRARADDDVVVGIAHGPSSVPM